MFDSPFEYCLVCRAYVLLDQTQRQCGREHSCTAVSKCPLQRFFTGMEFRERSPRKKEESTAIGPNLTHSVRHRYAKLRPS